VEQFQSDGFKGQRSPLVSLKAALPREGENTITFTTSVFPTTLGREDLIQKSIHHQDQITNKWYLLFNKNHSIFDS